MKRIHIIAGILLTVASFSMGRLYTQWSGAKGASTGDPKILYYVDPMNPGMKSDKPGKAPCGMPLEPVYAEGAGSKEGGCQVPGTVLVGVERQQLIGVRVETVEKAPWSHTIRVLGRIAPDETRVYRINAGTDGWIKKILPVTTDSLVEKDELLATFYAPEFASAMRAFLYGLRSYDRFEQSGQETKEQLNLTDVNIDNYRNSLRNLGMTEHQLNEIKRTRQGGEYVEIRAPEAGFVLLRNITLGQRFEKGTELYRIADLSKVWIVADTFETEASFFTPGLQVRASSPNLKKTFYARVAVVHPRFDPVGRTLQLRLEVDNPELLLRPDMFVDVELPLNLPAAITVPVDAVIETGLRKTVYVDHGNGYFEPRRVVTGEHLGRRIEITGGLMPGERIVVSGRFLIDSESRMKTAEAGTHEAQSKDPVCGTFVDEQKATEEGTTCKYEDRTVFFCSSSCKEDFEKDPGRYQEQKSEPLSEIPRPAMNAHENEEQKVSPVDQPVGPAPPSETAVSTPGAGVKPVRRRRGGPVAGEAVPMPANPDVEHMKESGKDTDKTDTAKGRHD